jgi:hypothetical protein
LYFTVLDMAKWDACALRRETSQENQSSANVDTGQTQQLTQLMITDLVGGLRRSTVIESSSTEAPWQGFTSYIGRYVDDKVTVIVLDNLTGGNAGKIGRHVACAL